MTYPDQMAAWRAERETLRLKVADARTTERALKAATADAERAWRAKSRLRNRSTTMRRALERELETFWTRKRALLSQRRRWARMHPGHALNIVMGEGARSR